MPDMGVTSAVYPVTLQTDNFWIEVGYVKNVADGATIVDPNNAGSDLVLIKKWDAWGLGVPTVGDWNTNSGSLTLSNTTSTVAFFVKVGGAGGSNVFFDNLTFTPEPASLILLALGLPILRRRR